MINKEVRNKLLNLYTKKEDRLFVGNVIDTVNKFQSKGGAARIGFLSLHEKNIAISVLNFLKVNYTLFNTYEDIERTVIFLIPKEFDDDDTKKIFEENITVLKITPNIKGKLTHKDYMGAIYSLGINEKMIGDIFATAEYAYVFMLNKAADYYINNLFYVARSEVKLEKKDIFSREIRNLSINYKSITIMTASLRVDAILAKVYNLSRNEIKTKIQNGDLYINSSEVFFLATEAKENDIISFRKCGKFKIGKVLRTAKSGKIALEVQKYV